MVSLGGSTQPNLVIENYFTYTPIDNVILASVQGSFGTKQPAILAQKILSIDSLSVMTPFIASTAILMDSVVLASRSYWRKEENLPLSTKPKELLSLRSPTSYTLRTTVTQYIQIPLDQITGDDLSNVTETQITWRISGAELAQTTNYQLSATVVGNNNAAATANPPYTESHDVAAQIDITNINGNFTPTSGEITRISGSIELAGLFAVGKNPLFMRSAVLKTQDLAGNTISVSDRETV